MIVYEPESVGTTKYEEKKPAPPKKVVALAIRRATDPALAKRTIDAKIVQIATRNRLRAERLMRALKVPFQPRSSTMSGTFWSWLTGAGDLSDLSKYTPEDRENLKEYLKADTIDVIAKTFEQDELDAILKKMKAGAQTPEDSLALDDPYSTASQAFQQSVTSTLAPMGEEAAKVGGSAAKKVGEGLVKYYRNDKVVPTRSYEWLKHMKWVMLATVAGVGGYIAWPHLKPIFTSDSGVGAKLNALKNLFGGVRS